VSPPPKKPSPAGPPPAVSFKEEVAGRETLAAIAKAQAGGLQVAAPRGPTATKHYGDRISNAPGAMSPKVARALDTAPDISVSLGYAGRATQAALDLDQRTETPEIEITGGLLESAGFDPSSAEIEQVHSFVIRATEEQLRAETVRKRLLEERLLHRMPGCFLEDVSDITIRPWGDGTVLIRVSTRVG